jgi:hypothetical protein
MNLEVEYLMRKEQYQDLIQTVEKDRLIQLAKQQQFGRQSAIHRQIVGWVGVQLVKWGAKLQQYAESRPVASLQITEQ